MGHTVLPYDVIFHIMDVLARSHDQCALSVLKQLRQVSKTVSRHAQVLMRRHFALRIHDPSVACRELLLGVHPSLFFLASITLDFKKGTHNHSVSALLELTIN